MKSILSKESPGVQSIPNNKIIANDIEPFIKTDEKANSSRNELLDEFDLLLSNHQLDNKISKKYLSRERLPKTILAIAGVLMCILGVIIILMPSASLNSSLKYIVSSCIIVTGVYLAVKFAL
ncbi:MAG: hypothetical protein JWP37_262 [Mucilaginibacter sp.]|nr:hypothetical protein [Mucilaginibacter sp.]